MGKVVRLAKVNAVERPSPDAAAPQDTLTITTTLYDLIESLQTTVEPVADALVIATVVRMLRVGKAAFVKPFDACSHRPPRP